MHRETLATDAAGPAGSDASTDGDSPTPKGSGPSHRHGPPSLGLLCVAALILTSSTIAYLRLRDSFFFFMDDFLQFDVASRFGLSWDLLTLDVFQHFAPINRLGHLFMLDVLHLDPRAGAVVAAVLVACVLTATAWLTYELGLSLVRRCLILVACGGSLTFLDTAVWNDAAWHILGALTATYLVVAIHLRALRTGSSWWHLVSVLAFAVGILTQERAAFALPMIVLTDLILVWRADPLRRRLSRLWAVRFPLLAMAIIGGIAAVYIKVNFGSSPGPGIRLTLRTMLMALTNFQFPQLAGIEPQNPTSVPVQLAFLALIVGGCAGLVWWNSANLDPILYFFAAFTLYWGFLILSPLLTADTAVFTAARLHNASYLTVPAFVAIFSLQLRRGRSSRTEPGDADRLDRARQRAPGRKAAVAGTALVVALLAYVTVMGGIFTNETWVLQRSGHTYLANMGAARAGWTDPGLTVIPMTAPAGVVQAWAVSYGRTDRLLTMLDHDWIPGDVTDRLVFFDQHGNLASASLQDMAVAAGSTAGSLATSACMDPAGATPNLTFTLDQQVPAGTPMLAEVTYTSDIGGQVLTASTLAGIGQTSVDPYPVRQGTHTVLLPLPDTSAPIDTVILDGPASFCVNALTVVRPLLAQPDGSCWVVDKYGTWIAPPTGVPCRNQPGS